MIHHGDCIEAMAGMDPESVDAIVTDPPYGLEFMGKEWDRLGDIGKTSHAGPKDRDASTVWGRQRVAFSGSSNLKCRTCGKWQWDHVGRKCECEFPDFPNVKAHQARLMQEWHARWAAAAYRVAKPSAYLLAFGGTRTVHRMTCALEDAGWIIRDMLVWGYASGFPKSKASLKPAWEPIVMARKPGPLRMLAIDECRIPMSADDPTREWGDKYGGGRLNKQGEPYVTGMFGDGVGQVTGTVHDAGRWPANIVLTDPIFDGGIEGVVGGGETGPAGVAVRHNSGGLNFGVDRERIAEAPPLGSGPLSKSSTERESHGAPVRVAGMKPPMDDMTYGDTGTYSRFFLVPKAARSDREPVLGGLPLRLGGSMEGGADTRTGLPVQGPARANIHPTVKPVDLMRHLVRLVTPTGGIVLDPFLGSGTTGIAAEMEGFDWIGIEREAEYVAIAEARLNGTQKGMAL